MSQSIQIRKMIQEDAPVVNKIFRENGIIKPLEYIEQCWKENKMGNRISLLAFYNEEFVGSLHLLSKSKYPYFVEKWNT